MTKDGLSVVVGKLSKLYSYDENWAPWDPHKQLICFKIGGNHISFNGLDENITPYWDSSAYDGYE